VGPDAVLFVIARSPDGGPPLAAVRLPTRRFPVTFALGPGDLMAADRPFAGPMRISARVDSDGDPLTRGPGDLVGEIAGLIDDGQENLEIVLHPVEQSPDG
jgi:cytochrome c-type biogenesis protein CcmH